MPRPRKEDSEAKPRRKYGSGPNSTIKVEGEAKVALDNFKEKASRALGLELNNSQAVSILIKGACDRMAFKDFFRIPDDVEDDVEVATWPKHAETENT